MRDAVAGVYRDRYSYVIGGFTPAGLTNQVQVYDLETKQWSQATPSPGTPVLGHAGWAQEELAQGSMRGLLDGSR